MPLSARRTALPLTFIIIVIFQLLPPASTGEEEKYMFFSDKYALPLHLLEDQEVKETYRRIGYNKATILFYTVLTNHHSHHEVMDTLMVDRICSSVERHTGLMKEVFHIPYLQSHQLFNRNKELRRRHFRIVEASRDIMSRLYRQKETSPRLLNDLDRLRHLVKSDSSLFYGTMVSVYEYQADYHFLLEREEEAFSFLELACQVAVETENYSRASHMAGRIGIYHLQNGDFTAGEEALLRSLDYAQRLGDHYFISRALSFLAVLREKEGFVSEAESLYLRALELCSQISYSICEISVARSLGTLYHRFNQNDRALFFAENIIFKSERGLRDDTLFNLRNHPFFLSSHTAGLALLADIQRDRGETDESIANLERAINLADQGIDRHFYAEMVKHLGDSFVAAGDMKRGAKAYREALKLSRKMKARLKEAEYRYALANLYLRTGEIAAARDHLQETLRLTRETGVWIETIKALHLLSRTYRREGEIERAKEILREAVAIFERRTGDRDFSTDKHSLCAEMNEVYDDLMVLENDSFDNPDSLLYWAEKSRHLSYLNGGGGREGIDQRITDLLSRREWIPADAAVIQYILLPDRIILAAIDPDTTFRHSIPLERKRLEKMVFDFTRLSMIKIPGCPCEEPPPVKGDISRLSRELGEILLGPAGAFISGKRRLAIIPDGVLHHLPFHALQLPGQEGRFLIESAQITLSFDLLALQRGGG
ncbi:MAG: tetratricopeptide repeat protein, partial [Candidatus Krumholzibacteriota bacterium]|nr:tetratricopeptide repeat protein [Candidatus Krumholzibacteriota bacterium]